MNNTDRWLLPEGIEDISPNFVKVYDQAISAEKIGLNELLITANPR